MADERTDGDRDVMSSLPSSRPARRSARRQRVGEPPATRSGAPAKAPAQRRIPPAGYATPQEPRASPATRELLGGAVRAAGEVAHAGAGVGRRVVRGTLGRLTGR